jgi:ABC-type multidrug transport system fused ATPase/permease subunit
MDAGMDPSAVFVSGRREGLFRRLRRVGPAADEDELVAAARELLQIERRARKPGAVPTDKETAVDKLLGPEGDVASLVERMAKLLTSAEGCAPITVEYRGLTAEADALVGKGAAPTVWNSILGAVRLLACQGGLKTRPLTVLKNVSGTLHPGRITLVLGPPGSGKSVLLQALSGRLRTGPTLRQSGSVRYNGVETSNFVVRRTAG